MSDRYEEMVERVDWFAPVDYEILQFYEQHDIQATAKVIAANIEYDRQYVNKRCNRLTDAGLLLKQEGGLFELSNSGRAFLAGELDAEDLERDETQQ